MNLAKYTQILKEHICLYILIFNLTLVRTSADIFYEIAFQSRLCEGVDVLQTEVRSEHLVIHILGNPWQSLIIHILGFSPTSLLLFSIFNHRRILVERARTKGLTETEKKLSSEKVMQKAAPWENNGGGGVGETGIWG